MKLRTFAHSRYLLPNCMAMVASRKDQGLAMESGTVSITEEMNEQPGQERIVVVYARVSAHGNRPHLDAQAERLCA